MFMIYIAAQLKRKLAAASMTIPVASHIAKYRCRRCLYSSMTVSTSISTMNGQYIYRNIMIAVSSFITA